MESRQLLNHIEAIKAELKTIRLLLEAPESPNPKTPLRAFWQWLIYGREAKNG